jgi:drug/metabolite transporter (DMT)-like permease
MTRTPLPTLLALAAIALWGTLAALGLALAHVPPFLLTGLTLAVGSLVALPLSRGRLSAWRVPSRTLALGVYGLFGFHFLLFMALRLAPAVQANLVNYLWPLLMVVLSPLLLPGLRLRAGHAVAAVLGFTGAALVMLGSSAAVEPASAHPHAGWGYAAALGSALVWASYSLWTRRVPAFPTAAVGGFAAASSALSLLCHMLWEPAASLHLHDAGLILLMGLGPMGAAFFLWDAALKAGDARQIGILSYLTPLLSTAALVLWAGRPLPGSAVLAVALIVGAAWLGQRASRGA